MATTGRAWPLKLKKRCEAVGWIVTMSRSGHYKVRTHAEKRFSFPSTPGDRRAELNALADARRHGIESLEATQNQRAEESRQRRLKRGMVGDALVDAMVDNETQSKLESNEEGESVRKEIAQKKGALGYVHGVAIEERAPAYVVSPSPVMNGARVLLHDASELLLESGAVVYRCEKLGTWKTDDTPSDRPCHVVFDKPESLRVHISFHGARQRETKPAAARVPSAKATVKKMSAKPAKASTATVGIVARAIQLADQFDHFKGELEILGKSADELVAELRELVRLLPDSVADEDLITKARKYEELRRLMG